MNGATPEVAETVDRNLWRLIRGNRRNLLTADGGFNIVLIRANVEAIRPCVLVRTAAQQPIICRRSIDESNLSQLRKKVAGRVDAGRTCDDHILDELTAGEVIGQRVVADTVSGANNPVFIVRRYVVRVDKPGMRGAVGGDDIGCVERGVVIDAKIGGCIDDLKEPSVAAPSRAAYVVKQIVLDLYVAALAGLDNCYRGPGTEFPRLRVARCCL